MKKCEQCWASFSRSGGAKFCHDCIPSVPNRQQMKWRALIRMYGVDKKMWDAMLFEQDFLCAICRERDAVALDHCHETGKARGILCLSCNTALGFIESSKFATALEYLTK